MQTAMLEDAQLVAGCLAGDRQAFGTIVERHQNLVCSLAYSATGNLAQSQDLAQLTFLTAWRRLGELREPAKLRAWLCGIVRNLILEARRRSRREPVHNAEPLDAAAGLCAPDAPPAEQVITREEETILWRSLEQIPELYREPLILFYRQQQSVAQVAAQLDLTEDAVKQRLARGRRMLEDRVTAFVEGALRRSGPGKVFTLGVLTALPAFVPSATAATLGATAVKGSAAAKAATVAGVTGALLGPVLGVLGGYLGARASIENTRSLRERRFMVRQAWLAAGLALAFMVAVLCLTLFSARLLRSRPGLFAALVVFVLVTYAIVLTTLILRTNRRQRQIQEEEAMKNPPPPSPIDSAPPLPGPRLFEYRSQVSWLGLPLVHVRFGQQPGTPPQWTRAWIAVGDRSLGVLLSFGGIAVGGIAIGGLALGAVSVGGLALGLAALGGAAFGGLALGGLAVGGLAVGGGAIGYLATGGAAIGWKASVGGLAISREFAQGGAAFAPHAFDEAARAYFQTHGFFSTATSALKSLSGPWAVPVILALSLVPTVVMLLLRRAIAKGSAEDVARS